MSPPPRDPGDEATPPAPEPARRLPGWVAGLAAAAIGSVVAVQVRINGRLGEISGDAVLSGLITFVGGLILALGMLAVMPGLRRSMVELRRGVRRGQLPMSYLFAGGIGGFFVFTQSATAALIGVAAFTVAAVAGQTMAGVLIDSFGLLGHHRRAPTAHRLLGTGLVLGAVLIGVSGAFGGTDALQQVGPTLLAFFAGLTTSAQYAMNSRVGAVAGTPLGAGVANVVAGTVIMLAVFLARLPVTGPPQLAGASWPLFTGGLWGILFIVGLAWLMPHSGVLVVSLGSVSGQLLGSIVMDAVVPIDAVGVTWPKVVGAVVALGGVVIASLPSRRRAGPA